MSRPALLDVNVLVALFDPDHIHHEAAHRWFAAAREEGWATCPLTENALVRILSNAAYTVAAYRVSQIASRLTAFRKSAGHEFWEDRVSLCDASRFRLERLTGHGQLTDVYLLALAVERGGRLATFDAAIPIPAVREAGEEHRVLIPA